MKFSHILALPILLGTMHVASATVVVAKDGFQAGAGTVIGTNGGTGWAGAWQSGQPANAPQIIDVGGQGALQFTQNGDSVATRTLSSTQSGTVFVDFLFQFSGVLGHNDFLGLWFGNSTGPNIGLKANCGTGAAGCTNDLFVRNSGAAGSMLNGSDVVANTTYRVYGHLYKTAPNGNYNRFDAWINPTAQEIASLSGADASFSGPSNISSFDTIGFRAVNLDNNVSVRIDNLQISAVPEPSSLALLGLALLGMGAVLRRKAA